MTGPATPVQQLRTLMEARETSGRGEWDAAARLWELVVAGNPTRADFWDGLASARFDAGNFRAARAAYSEAFDLGAGFPFNIAYKIAACYARTDQMDLAFEWLERAFELGYRDVQGAQVDDAFAPLHQSGQFRDLVGLIDAEKLSRDEGWQYDLAFFAREVKRKAYFPWRKLDESTFDAEIESLDQRIPELDDVEIVVEMRRIITLLGDGHANVFFPADHPDAPDTLPLQFSFFEEGLYITAAHPDHAGLPGHRVLQIGGSPVQEVIHVVTPIVPRDNDQWLKLKIPYLIRELPVLEALGLIPDAGKAVLTLMDASGAEKEVEVPAGKNLPNDELYYAFPYPAGWEFYPNTLGTPLPRYIRNQASYYWFEHIEEYDAVYFQFNRVRDSAVEALEEFTDRLFSAIDGRSAGKLIIDLRCNNGGNTFLEMPFLHRLIGHDINQRGRLFVITGRRTFSAAQNFSTMIERHTEAIFVGEPTGASPNFVGENIIVTLPYSGIGMNVSDLYWQSSWPMDHRTWIAPTLYVPPTFAAYRENRDPALEAILSWQENFPGR